MLLAAKFWAMGFTRSHHLLITVVLLGGCTLSLDDPTQDEQCNDPGHEQCMNGGIRACVRYEDGSTSVSFWSCGTSQCVEVSESEAECVLPDVSCPEDASSICIDNVGHGCYGTRADVDGVTCSAGTTCRTGTNSNRISKAVCAIDATPCKAGGVSTECRDNVLVECDAGWPVKEQACDADERCFEDESTGVPRTECAPPIDCPLPGKSVCVNNSVYICSGSLPKIEARCGDGFCLDANDWRACYAASDGPAALVWEAIPAGSFAVGSKLLGDTRPLATVGSFSLLKTEVTTGQYMGCVAAGACDLPPATVYTGLSTGRGDLPISAVTANEAKAFCRWVGGALPTELEWEYAERNAGADVLYPWGDAPLSCAEAVVGAGGPLCVVDQPGCSRTPDITSQGVCDLVGNLSEWVLAVPAAPGMTGVRGTYYGGLDEPTESRQDSDDDRSDQRGFRCARH